MAINFQTRAGYRSAQLSSAERARYQQERQENIRKGFEKSKKLARSLESTGQEGKPGDEQRRDSEGAG